MTDDVTITLFLGVFALIIVSWAWYLHGVRQIEILKKAFADDFPNSWGTPVEKPAKRPRLYKQATVVTKGELPRKAPVKTVAKKVAKKTTTTKVKK